MKRPVNFETINSADFEMEGHSFYFDFDNMQNYEHRNWVWVFCNGPILGDYCVLFELKWEMNCYSMKRCVLGAGDAGDYLFQDNLLTADMARTKDAFIGHFSKVINKAIRLNKFKN